MNAWATVHALSTVSPVPNAASRPSLWLRTQRTRITMCASHEDLVRALVVLGFDKGNVSTSLKGLAAKGRITITRTPGGKAEAVDLTCEGRMRAVPLTASCKYGVEDR